jgi:hypothetical protein
MVACPRCKSEDYDIGKSWDVIPKSGKGRAMHVTMYSCKICGHKFRKAAKLDVTTNNAPHFNNFDIKPTFKLESAISFPKPAEVEVTHPTPIIGQNQPEVYEAPQKDTLFQRIKRGLGF